VQLTLFDSMLTSTQVDKEGSRSPLHRAAAYPLHCNRGITAAATSWRNAQSLQTCNVWQDKFLGNQTISQKAAGGEVVAVKTADDPSWQMEL